MNPLFKNGKGEDVNTPSNPLNEADKSYNQSRNTFSFDRPHFTSLSFADITPYEAVEGLGEDNLEFGSKHHLRTYTLKSTLMSDIFIKKSYYMLDMRAILPNNWEKIYREPAKGNDVPENGYANTFTDKLFTSLAEIKSLLKDSSYYNPGSLDFLFKLLFLYESIFSDGSLFARLYSHYSSLIHFDNSGTDVYIGKSFDQAINLLYSEINTAVVLGGGIGSYMLLIDKETGSRYSIGVDMPFTNAIELARTYGERYVFSFDLASAVFGSVLDLILNFFKSMSFNGQAIVGFPVNFSRIAAYQLVCAEYFTNSKIDDIYSAQLYLQNMSSLWIRLRGGQIPYFVYNGVHTQYDALSGYALNEVLGFLRASIASNSFTNMDLYFGYLFNLFTIRKSMRYGDYFTGARPEPYAAVDMESEVIDGKVSAIDTTRATLAQRFANAVARSNRKFSDYLTDVIGGYDVPDVEMPRWLASKTSRIDGFEVENTTNINQGNIVTVLNSSNSDYIYSVDCGSPCIIIGVATCSMERFYSQSVDRLTFHKDRDDMFNKFMQFVGDQDVEAREYRANLLGQFAYQIRHMEYKQRFPVVSGAWRDFLPPMFLIADKVLDVESDNGIYTINQYNIRSLNSELDPFYASLTNFGLASRFHFMAKFENNCTAKRKMARQPSIL